VKPLDTTPLKSFLASTGRGLKSACLLLARASRAAGRELARGARRIRTSALLARTLRGTLRVTRRIARIGGTAAAGAALVLGGLWLCCYRVPAASIGVRQTQWGGRGIAAQDFESGLHFGLRGWHGWDLLDRRTHFAFFGASEQGADEPILDLRTKQGNEIKVALLVPYRILPGEGHELVRDGLKSSYRGLVSATIQDVLMRELAELTADEYASTEARSARMATALPKLNAILARFHVRAESIQIHDIVFWAQYDKILQQKQLTRQLALLAQAATQVEEELRRNKDEDIAGAVGRIRGELDKEIETVRSEGKLAISRVRSQAAAFEKQRRAQAQAENDRLLAEADFLIYQAESLQQRLTNTAYDTAGGRIELARQAASNLRIREVVLNSNDPRCPSILDLDQLAGLLIGRAGP
jgi:SPFH domain/Band 7 family protein